MSQSAAPKVSIYKNIRQSTGGDTFPLFDIYEAIRTEYWKPRVDVYQSMPKETKAQEEEAKEYKNSLPYFTGCAVFPGRRKAGEPIEPNDRIILDIDSAKSHKNGVITPENIHEIKTTIANDEFTEAVWITVSGEGLAVSVKIESDKFAESFKALQAYYMNRFGWQIDKSCSDITRPRFISADKDLRYNPTSSIFIVGRDYVGHVKRVTSQMIKEAGRGEVHHTLIKASRLMGGYIGGNLINESEAEEWLVDCMRSKDGVVNIEIERNKIRDGINNGKGNPITAQMLLISEQNNEAEKAVMSELYGWVHAMNRAGRKYTDADVVMLAEKFCTQVTISKPQIESIFKKIFEQNADEFGIDDKPDIVKVEVYLRKNYTFRRNVITQIVEFSEKNGVLTELNLDTIYRKLQHIGFKFALAKLDSLLKSDFVPDYNPFAEYFLGLKETNPWDPDKSPDFIKTLASYVHLADQEFFETQFKKALVRSIGCALYGVENRIVFVLVGETQETGKSSFIRYLNPFGMKYYTEAPIHNNKDSSFAFSENFIYNLEELSELNKIEVNRLKAIISTATIKERKAYARTAKEQPRRCNFFASTNKSEFLIDTSNTRWLCFNVDSIVWGYRSEVNINDVWSQAFSLWQSGFDCQLTAEEKEARNLKNKNYEVNDLERELIKRIYKVCRADEGEFVSNADILEHITKAWSGTSSALSARWIGKNMVQLGFVSGVKCINGHTCRGYFVEKNNLGADGMKYEQTEAVVNDNDKFVPF